MPVRGERRRSSGVSGVGGTRGDKGGTESDGKTRNKVLELLYSVCVKSMCIFRTKGK